MSARSVRQQLDRLGHEPKRSLGQNFLVDPDFARPLVRALAAAPGDLLIEVGPGLGALSDPLIETAAALDPPAAVLLLEKDDCLAAELSRRLAEEKRIPLEVVHEDALTFDWRRLCGPRRVLLLGNLPYNISTAVIAHFGSPISPVERMVLTVQKEVGERLCAPPDTRDYGALTVLVQRWWRVRHLRAAPPDVFHPRPRVDSSILLFERRPHTEIGRCDGEHLERLVHTGFSQRRKQLRKLLHCDPQVWDGLAVRLGFSPQARAEDLDPMTWQGLAAAYAPDVSDHSPLDGEEIFDVVDEQDRVIASVPRSQVHATNLRHRAVHMILRNRAGEIFLQRRAPWKEINPGVWDSSAAGHLDAGETYAQAAVRELEEELGVQAELHPIGKLTPCAATGNEFIEVYRGEHEGPFRLAGLEIIGGAFFPLEQIKTWAKARPKDFSPVFLLCLSLLEKTEPDVMAQ